MSLNTLEEYDDNFVKKVIKVLLTNKDYLTEIESGIVLEHFHSPEQQWIVEKIKQYYQKYKTIPTVDYLTIELKKFTQANEKNQPVASLIKKMLKYVYNEETDVDDLPYVKDQYTEFCKKQAFINVTENLVELIEAGRYQDIVLKYQQASQIGVPPLQGHFLKEQFDEVFRDDLRTIVPWHLPEFNELFAEKGISGGSVVINLGQPAGGKSWFGVAWATFLAKAGYNVVYFNLESEFVHVARRFYACINEIPLDQVLYNREAIEASLNSLEGEVIITDLKREQKTIDYIENYLERLKETRNINPHLVIIDYVNLLKHKNSKDELVGQQKTWEDVTDLAKTGDFVVYSPSPIGRDGFGDKVITGAKIGGAIKAIYDTDFIMSFSSHNIAHIIKNKNGKGNGKSFEMEYDSSCGKFAVIDEYFDEESSSKSPKGSSKLNAILDKAKNRKFN